MLKDNIFYDIWLSLTAWVDGMLPIEKETFYVIAAIATVVSVLVAMWGLLIAIRSLRRNSKGVDRSPKEIAEIIWETEDREADKYAEAIASKDALYVSEESDQVSAGPDFDTGTVTECNFIVTSTTVSATELRANILLSYYKETAGLRPYSYIVRGNRVTLPSVIKPEWIGLRIPLWPNNTPKSVRLNYLSDTPPLSADRQAKRAAARKALLGVLMHKIFINKITRNVVC
uniref:Uncharacterized protein n=1 Tax=Candidatus Kentrum sp. TC TaxID=2126339 RepID=A0A450ZQV7_9GAMM|nr:MAG: hypothetical protein BECKTC1821F_GA0114240_100950 [Candidatus Kentron sp. TC]